MGCPNNPKIYHILHKDRLSSLLRDGNLWCDAIIAQHPSSGSTIGMERIKQRRLNELTFNNYPDLHVGECVPFYFCPRSVMLYIIFRQNNQDLAYKGGQIPIVHLEADLFEAVRWCSTQKRRWVFTLTNAGSCFFEDRASLEHLNEINWTAVQATNWSNCKDGKQAEFLIETSFPLTLVERIGVHHDVNHSEIQRIVEENGFDITVDVKRDWYY